VFLTVGRKGAEERLSSALRGRGGRRVGHRGMTSGKAASPRSSCASAGGAGSLHVRQANGPAGHPALARRSAVRDELRANLEPACKPFGDTRRHWLRRETIEESARQQHWRYRIHEVVQVPVAGNERLCAARTRQNDEIIIARIRREANDQGWVRHDRFKPA